MTTLARSHIGISTTDRAVGSGWGWLVALGLAMIALGALAFFNLPAATNVSVYAVSIFMLIGAVAQLAAASMIRGATGFGHFLLSAVLYGVTGGITIANPQL